MDAGVALNWSRAKSLVVQSNTKINNVAESIRPIKGRKARTVEKHKGFYTKSVIEALTKPFLMWQIGTCWNGLVTVFAQDLLEVVGTYKFATKAGHNILDTCEFF